MTQTTFFFYDIEALLVFLFRNYRLSRKASMSKFIQMIALPHAKQAMERRTFEQNKDRRKLPPRIGKGEISRYNARCAAEKSDDKQNWAQPGVASRRSAALLSQERRSVALVSSKRRRVAFCMASIFFFQFRAFSIALKKDQCLVSLSIQRPRIALVREVSPLHGDVQQAHADKDCINNIITYTKKEATPSKKLRDSYSTT